MEPSDKIIEADSDPETQAKPSYRKPAIIVSILFHVGLVVVLLFWYLPDKRSAPITKQTTASPSSSGSDDQSGSAKPPPPAPVADVPPEQIKKSVQAQIEQVNKLSDEQKLSELEKNLRRLESVANKDSVKEVTTTIASTLGLDQQQYAPKEEVTTGQFDTDSGQLHDVTRRRDKSGKWQYESVLVDAEGRKMTVPMSAAEGETVYNTFQQMKKFPLAEGIYRGVVMPMIQKMLEAEELAQKAANEAQRMQQRDQEQAEYDTTAD